MDRKLQSTLSKNSNSVSIERQFKISSTLDVEIPVVLCDGLLSAKEKRYFEDTTHPISNPRRRLVVVDENVFGIYGQEIQRYFEKWGISATFKVISVDESVKNLDMALEVVSAMSTFGLLRRQDPVIGIGGGVLLDIVGFAASLYRRGVPYIRIPTTLMGLVDAGIGVKTGVNLGSHKNRLGTYYAPRATYVDKRFIQTQNDRHIANGLAEIIKIALVKDSYLLDLLEKHSDHLVLNRFQGPADYDQILKHAIVGMMEELEPNLWEANLERIVDYGHTFSPTIEMKALPNLLHGEAVAIDMALCLLISEGRRLMTPSETSRAIRLMRAFDLPVSHPVCSSGVLESALADAIKHRDGYQRIPLCIGIGKAAFVNDITKDEVRRATERLFTYA